MSTDPVLNTSSDFLLKVYGIGTIPAGGSKNFSPAVFIPPELAQGSYHVIVELDPTNVVPESNESNNVTSSAGTVTIGSGGAF